MERVIKKGKKREGKWRNEEKKKRWNEEMKNDVWREIKKKKKRKEGRRKEVINVFMQRENKAACFISTNQRKEVVQVH